jgi:uncharacterized protein (TIGR02611 family)
VPLDLHSPVDLLRWIARNTRRLVVTLAGFAVLGAGLAMLVLPGPGVLIIVVGLAILATEFAWAERALDRTASTAATATSKVTSSRSGKLALAASAVSMVAGGALVIALVGQHRLIGVGVLVAGLIALATLLPRVQGWVGQRAGGTAGLQVAPAVQREEEPA